MERVLAVLACVVLCLCGVEVEAENWFPDNDCYDFVRPGNVLEYTSCETLHLWMEGGRQQAYSSEKVSIFYWPEGTVLGDGSPYIGVSDTGRLISDQAATFSDWVSQGSVLSVYENFIVLKHDIELTLKSTGASATVHGHTAITMTDDGLLIESIEDFRDPVALSALFGL